VTGERVGTMRVPIPVVEGPLYPTLEIGAQTPLGAMGPLHDEVVSPVVCGAWIR